MSFSTSDAPTWTLLDEVVSDTARIDRFINRVSEIGQVSDPSEGCLVLKECAALLGIESAAFATFVEEDPWHQSYRFLLACHPAWCAEYQRLAWFADDPWLAYARTNAVPARSTEIAVRTDKQRYIVELARRFGVESALIVPTPSSPGVSRLGVLMLGSSRRDFFDAPAFSKYKVFARSLALEVYDWYVAFLRSQLVATAKLTEKDIELLQHERAGVSTKDIARSLGMQTSAIDSRFQRIIARLGVHNRRAAARVAAEYGLI